MRSIQFGQRGRSIVVIGDFSMAGHHMLLMWFQIHFTNATTPQPREPNQTIITETMNMTRNAVASFRPIGTGADRALIDECNSTRGGSFIVLPLSDERRETEGTLQTPSQGPADF